MATEDKLPLRITYSAELPTRPTCSVNYAINALLWQSIYSDPSQLLMKIIQKLLQSIYCLFRDQQKNHILQHNLMKIAVIMQCVSSNDYFDCLWSSKRICIWGICDGLCPSVFSVLVITQMVRSGCYIITLVTLVGLFPTVRHHMGSQMDSLGGWIVTLITLVGLFPSVSSLVNLKIECFWCYIITVIALIGFFPSVRPHM